MAESSLAGTRETARTIAALLAGAWHAEPPSLPAGPLDEALGLVAQTNAAALVWWRLRKSALRDDERVEALHDAYRYAALKTQQQESSLVSVVRTLRGVAIEPILLKGWDIARLYPRSELRPYEDIDVIVRPQDEAAAQRALAAGSTGEAIVDFYHSEITVFDRGNWDELFARSRLIDFGGTAVRVLSAEDHLRAICLHGLKHCFSNPLWLCDVAVSVEAAGDEFDWSHCFGERRPQDQWIGCALELARELLGARLPAAAAARIGRLPRWLVPNVLDTWIRWATVGSDERWAVRELLDRPAQGLNVVARRWPNQLVVKLKRRAPLTDDPLWLQRINEFGYLFEAKRVVDALVRNRPERSTP